MKSQRGFAIIEGLLILVILALVGYGGYYVWHKNNTKTNTSSPTQSSDVVAQVKALVAAKYTSLTANNEDGDNLMVYKLSNYSFASTTQTEANQTASYKTKNNDTISQYPSAMENDVKKIFADTGYTIESSQPAAIDQVSVNIGQKNIYFQKDDNVCELDVSTSSVPLSVKCSPLAAIAKSAGDEKPFYDALVAGGNPSNMIGIPNISNSQTAGYRTASLGISSIGDMGGAGAKFYSKNNGPWIYFTAGQQGPTCDMFNTVDLKAAFKGMDCINAKSGDIEKV